MSGSHLSTFRYVWLVDFEFHQPDGDRPTPICMVAREYRTGRTLRLWLDELAAMASPPFSTGVDALFVAYYASAGAWVLLGIGLVPTGPGAGLIRRVPLRNQRLVVAAGT